MLPLLPHLALYLYIATYIQQHSYAPVINEMMAALQKSRGAIQNSLNWLEHRQYIERQAGKARTIKIRQPLTLNIPIWGTIAAGYLAEACPNGRDCLPVIGYPFNPGDFALQVAGDSMIGDRIADGSFVIMRPVVDASTVKNGEIVAALVEGQGTTLKHFYRDGRQVLLAASNPKYPPIRIDTQDCQVQIQGVFIDIWRDRQ